MIFLFLQLNFHLSLQGKSLSERRISRSVPLLSTYKHQLNRSFELCPSHLKLFFIFFYYLCKINCRITSSQPRHHLKSEKNPSFQVSRTCSGWIMTGKKARQQVFLSVSFVLCYIGQSVHIQLTSSTTVQPCTHTSTARPTIQVANTQSVLS